MPLGNPGVPERDNSRKAAARESCHKPFGIPVERELFLGIIKRYIGIIGKQVPDHRGFPRLAGSGQVSLEKGFFFYENIHTPSTSYRFEVSIRIGMTRKLSIGSSQFRLLPRAPSSQADRAPPDKAPEPAATPLLFFSYPCFRASVVFPPPPVLHPRFSTSRSHRSYRL